MKFNEMGVWGLVVIGAVIGLWILKNYSVKRATPVAMVKESNVSKEISALPTQFTTDSTGVKRQTVELAGVVQNWNYQNAMIEFTSMGKSWKFNIDPTVVTIFVPSLKNKGQELLVKKKSGLRWQTAFCKGDMITVRLADSKVIFIDNAGYRSCGYKGE